MWFRVNSHRSLRDGIAGSSLADIKPFTCCCSEVYMKDSQSQSSFQTPPCSSVRRCRAHFQTFHTLASFFSPEGSSRLLSLFLSYYIFFVVLFYSVPTEKEIRAWMLARQINRRSRAGQSDCTKQPITANKTLVSVIIFIEC